MFCAAPGGLLSLFGAGTAEKDGYPTALYRIIFIGVR